MQFLKTLFWVLARGRRRAVRQAQLVRRTFNLWSDIQADIKLPILLLIAFLIGFLPTWLIMRARLWSLRRRIEALERNQAAPLPPKPAAEANRSRPYEADLRRHRHARPRPREGALPTRCRDHAGGIKLGLEFFCANGREGVREMAELGLPIFLDLKLHDIPNTVAKAVQALARSSRRSSPSTPPAGRR